MTTPAPVDETTPITVSSFGVVKGYSADERKRHLVFVGPEQTVGRWIQTMRNALGWNDGTYNDFDVEKVGTLLKEFSRKGIRVHAGREYSAVVYVTGPTKVLLELGDAASCTAPDSISLQTTPGLRSTVLSNLKKEKPDVAALPETGLCLRLWWD